MTHSTNINLDSKGNDLAVIHLFYLGGLLVEGIKNLHIDLMQNCKSAAEIMARPSYLRMTELRDKFEQAALINNQ